MTINDFSTTDVTSAILLFFVADEASFMLNSSGGREPANVVLVEVLGVSSY